MSKINLNRLVQKAGTNLAKAKKATVETVKDSKFLIGVLTSVPTTISTFFLIKKYQRQAEEKEALYEKALAKHNAVIKELSAKAEMDKEKRDRLLAYDAELKKEISNLQSEKQELKKQIADLEKKKANDE